MHELGEPVPESMTVNSQEQALAFAHKIGYPLVVRPAFTPGGRGGGFARDEQELRGRPFPALWQSPIRQCLTERSIAGYKEIEYEVLKRSRRQRHHRLRPGEPDPVGVHTGDLDRRRAHLDADRPPAPDAAQRVPAHRQRTWHRRRLQRPAGADPHSDRYFTSSRSTPRLALQRPGLQGDRHPIARLSTLIAIGYNLHELKKSHHRSELPPCLNHGRLRRLQDPTLAV